MESLASFSHTGNIGDIWSAIPAMRQFFLKTGKLIRLYLVKNVRGEYYEGAVHPTKDVEGNNVMLNEKMIEMMTPLLLAQGFIKEVITITEQEYKTTDIHCHLEWIREANVGMPNFPIQKWYSTIFPDLDFDLADKWLEVPDSEKDLAKGKIIVTRSERYTNQMLDYSFLKPYEDDMLFCGTMREYNIFTMTYDLNVRKLNINNFLELAQAIKQCKFHISNQTQAFQLSEGQKIPRMLEACVGAPNCIPVGKDAFYYLNQMKLECDFHKLNGSLSEAAVHQKLKADSDKKLSEMESLKGINKPV
jgi:hypothetical protein